MDTLQALQREYSIVEQKYKQVLEEFKQKYSTELRITGTGSIDLRKRGDEQKKRERAQKRLENRERSTLAFHAKDFLRPRVDDILADIARKIEQD